MLRWLMSIFLVCSLFLSGSAHAVTPEDYNPSAPEKLRAGHLYGQSCIVVDADSGEVLWKKKADARCEPASITKIMTCILGLESPLMGTMISIPAGIVVPADSSRMGLTAGDRMSFDDLLYGLMLASGNDAAVAVAMLVSGSEEDFVRQMNDKARALGMSGTHFANSHGYPQPDHYSTARDLATLMRYALKNERFRAIISATEHVIYSTCHPEGWRFSTKYDLIVPGSALYYAPSLGGKSGYHSAAGRCFAGAACENGITLVTVTLHSDPADSHYAQAFTDTIRLSQYGFARLSRGENGTVSLLHLLYGLLAGCVALAILLSVRQQMKKHPRRR